MLPDPTIATAICIQKCYDFARPRVNPSRPAGRPSVESTLVPPRFAPAVVPPAPPSEGSLWAVVRDSELLLTSEDASLLRIERVAAAGVDTSSGHFLGSLDGIDCWAVALPPDASEPQGTSFTGLRPLLARGDDELFALAGRALQIVGWDDTHRYCGRCGTPTDRLEGERAKECPACGLLAYPRVSPAVIMRVTRGDKILLARGRRFPQPIYSTLAGFVDPGESLEECVAREVREEAGIEIRGLAYFGSQSWPFPHSLMVGFTAEHAGGELVIDEEEIVDAGWYTRDALPLLPPHGSIARRLIDDYLSRA
jgi:NAD+ diphosphatase